MKKSLIDVRSKLMQRSLVKHIENMVLSKREIKAPYIVELDPTAACDLACPGCISEDVIAEGGRFSNERLIELANEIVEAGVRGVILIGGGEPLAHPKIGQLITTLGTNNVALGITTNGTFIHRYLDEIAEYASWTRVSFDAASEETFCKLRPSKAGKSKYQTILDNMRALAKVKRGYLGFSFLIQTKADGPQVTSNVSEIFNAALLARDLGCDYFEVKPTYQWRDNVPHALMEHESDQMDLAKAEIEKVRSLASDTFSIYEAINLQASLDGVQSVQEKNYSRCPIAELRTLITPKGGYICPYWRGKSEMRIGDFNTESFDSVWRGLQRSIVMDRVNPSDHCNFHCLRHGSNQQILEMKNLLKSGQPVQIVDDYDPFI